jgi:hypothetical protein
LFEVGKEEEKSEDAVSGECGGYGEMVMCVVLPDPLGQA